MTPCRNFLHTACCLLLTVCCLLSCGPVTNTIESEPLGYNLKEPKAIPMPPVLNELSGMTYYPKDSSLFGVEDENGYLYKIYPNHPATMARWKFGEHGDFEDVVKRDSIFYVLRADGSIYHVLIQGVDNVITTVYEFPEKGSEFEGLYWEDSLKVLVLVCKDCAYDKKNSVSTWFFNPDTHQFFPGTFGINAKDIAGQMGGNKMKLKPSAAAINPINHKLYVLSSVNKMLIIANRDGTINGVYGLNDKLYKQPEGIAFAPDGTLFISNEQSGKGTATLLMMPYKPKKEK